MKKVIKTHIHTIISVVLMVLSLFIGVQLYTGLLLIGFWAGREHSQAEYRYMKLKGINRGELRGFDGLRREAWNYDSFVNDMMLPILVGVLLWFAL